jgi:glycosyltransferase involved in cell wall biosynthesis
MRVALVHEWLPVYAGAERVLEQFIHLFPEADLFSLIEFLPEDQRHFLQGKPVQTSFIQKLPFAKEHYRYYLPLTPLAIEQFDLTGYDLVLSHNYAVAKGVLTTNRQLHLCYVSSPIRYAWDLYFQYLRESGLERGLKAWMGKLILHYIRLYDVATASRPDLYLANSRYVAQRIWKTWRRPATVVYPPVDTDAFALHEAKEDFYFTVSRMVPYKKIDLIVEAFSAMPDRRLVVIGDGPDFDKVQAKAGRNVELLGYQPFRVVKDYMARARAFVFAAEEDFGIVPVEAQACGTPVIAFGRGGAEETVIAGETGLFFAEQTVASLKAAVDRMEATWQDFAPGRIRQNAERFSVQRFRHEVQALVAQAWTAFQQDGSLVAVHPAVESLSR